MLSLAFPRNRFLELCWLVMIFLVFAFNGGSADYDAYKTIYYNEAPLSFFSGNKEVEIGYQILCRLFRNVLGFSFETFWITITGISVIGFYKIVKRYTKNTAFVLSLFAIFPMLISAVQFRQWLSGVIVLYGVRYLESAEKKGVVKYVSLCLLATTIHMSSIFYLLFILSFRLNIKKVVMMAVVWIIGGSLFTKPMLQFVSRYNARVLRLLGSDNNTSFVTQAMMLLLLFGLFIIMKYINGKVVLAVDDKSLSPMAERGVWIVKFSLWVSVFSLFLWPFFLITIEIFRLIRIVIIIEYISLSYYISLRIKEKRERMEGALLIIVMLIVSMVCLYVFCIKGRYLNTVFLPLLNENRFFEIFNFTY